MQLSILASFCLKMSRAVSGFTSNLEKKGEIMSKRGSLNPEEEIDVKPSTELIPDEYEHSKQKINVHSFAGNNKSDRSIESKFLKTLENIEYEIKDVNKHCLETANLEEIFNGIINECTDDTAGLILLFSCSITEAGNLSTDLKRNIIKIEEIWKGFSSYDCLALKNKPKIFIFDLLLLKEAIQYDGQRHVPSFQSTYDTPAEADMLIICNRTTDDETEFMEQFCENIKEHGETENIITLASCTACEIPPLIISTLTRNFYFTASKMRGHHLTIEKHHQEIKTNVEEIKEVVKNTCTEKKETSTEKKKKPSLLQSFSFRSKIKPKTSAAGTRNKVAPTTPPATQPKRPSGSYAIRKKSISQSEREKTAAKQLGEKKKPDWK